MGTNTDSYLNMKTDTKTDGNVNMKMYNTDGNENMKMGNTDGNVNTKMGNNRW